MIRLTGLINLGPDLSQCISGECVIKQNLPFDHKIKEKRKKDTSSTTSTSGTHIQGPEDLLLHSETS